jgi:hypothetical protein
MSPEEALRVMQAFRAGATYSYTSYAAEAQFRYRYDDARRVFVVEEHPAHDGDVTEQTFDEQTFSQHLASMRFDEITIAVGILKRPRGG